MKHFDLKPYIKDISLITHDSRKVIKDSLFVAVDGNKVNGSNFIEQAISNGVQYIVCNEKEASIFSKKYTSIKFITTDNPRKSLSEIASLYYPKQPQNIVAITGTNGKTSTIHFVKEIWNFLGYKCASLGTLGLIKSYEKTPDLKQSMSTPDPIALHQILQQLAEEDVTHLAMEASSHGIHQHRLDNVNLKATAFSNLTIDHLDYHQTMEEYLKAKLRLFEILPNKSSAVLNADIPEYNALQGVCSYKEHNIISYGYNGSEIKILSTEPTITGQNIKISILGKDYKLQIPLIGEFQVYNLLCALGLVLATNKSKIDLDALTEFFRKIEAVPGRMQKVIHNNNSEKTIIVDYAHSSDSLEKALITLSNHKKNKVIIVFGCGGERDPNRRSGMAQVASKYCDLAIITDDNPRSDDPDLIRKEIISHCTINYLEIADRRKAIDFAIKNMHKDDILLIAGKGHETYQIVGSKVYDFDDYKIAKEIAEQEV